MSPGLPRPNSCEPAGLFSSARLCFPIFRDYHRARQAASSAQANRPRLADGYGEDQMAEMPRSESFKQAEPVDMILETAKVPPPPVPSTVRARRPSIKQG